MATPLLDGPLPVARCAPCGRRVLAYLTFDDAGDERRRCIHCDAELDPAEIEWLDEAQLDDAGYAVLREAENCGKPDCGGGRCGRG